MGTMRLLQKGGLREGVQGHGMWHGMCTLVYVHGDWLGSE